MKGAFYIEYDENGHVIISSPFDSDGEIELTDLEKEAVSYIQKFCGEIDIDLRSDSYLTICNKSGNDFCRIKVTPRTKWFSLDMSGTGFEDDQRLESVTNKNQRHWKIKLNSVDELEKYADIIQASSKIVY